MQSFFLASKQTMKRSADGRLCPLFAIGNRQGQQEPPDQKADSANRSDGAQPGDAGKAQQVQTS